MTEGCRRSASSTWSPRELPAGTGHGQSWLVAVTVHNAGAAAVEVPSVIRSGTFSTTKQIRVPGLSNTTERVVVESAPTEVVLNDGSHWKLDPARTAYRRHPSRMSPTCAVGTLRRAGWRGTGTGAEHVCPPLNIRVHESATGWIASAVVELLGSISPVSSASCGQLRAGYAVRLARPTGEREAVARGRSLTAEHQLRTCCQTNRLERCDPTIVR